MTMISISEAIAIIKANIPAPVVEECPLDQALGRYLAEDIQAPEPSPRYTNSAMDGYAVRWGDVRDLSLERPATLAIIGESRAGVPFSGTVGAGCAVRISTGAMLPDGVDTVIRVEDTREAGQSVIINVAKRLGQDVRQRGEEFGTGDLLLRLGARIAAPQAALLAAVGIARVKVFKPCDVALLATGSELIAAGSAIADHQIRDSNMTMLRAAVLETGAQLVSRARITDDRQATVAAIGQAAADIILCTGGVSVGRHDHVKEAAEENGFTPLFWRIRQKPGKPLYLARKGKTLLFGLPGNPVSAFMCFTHYVRPLIGAIRGLSFGWPIVFAQVGEEIVNKGGRPNMLRVRMTCDADGGYAATSAARQGSHMLTSLVDSDGYIIMEPGQAIQPGERVLVYSFDFR
ncbi:MAG: molybdopterin molybdenumtransferase MoeA [Deltaproteobacteria bacterium CG23_combo_of_CG06-09_8_20_14_all_60_8]|nr:MAG: molybdopterin molybdenumtransferase MoeA [Deltaproteobacteria bacterium CG23_combo_of_CG06-09_8_20_14_all_60_8]